MMSKFSIFVTPGTNNLILLEHTDKRPNGKMLGWVFDKSVAENMVEALERFDDQEPVDSGAYFTVSGKHILYDGEWDVGVFQFQTQAKRTANALNHLYLKNWQGES